jgi:hypothetical protein
MNDWSGNKKTIFVTLGASSHANEDREENDYYATDPKAVDILVNECPITFPKDVPILEPCCGGGHLSKRFEELGYNVTSSDLIDRGYGETGKDFISSYNKWEGNIVTNPPYKYAMEFVLKALEIVDTGKLVAMFLKLQFMEGKARKKMFILHPPRYLLVSCSRILCGKNANFSYSNGSAVAYAWYVWEKGYKGRTEILWVN